MNEFRFPHAEVINGQEIETEDFDIMLSDAINLINAQNGTDTQALPLPNQGAKNRSRSHHQ